MPKPSNKLMDLEADRLAIIHDQQKKLRKQLNKDQKNVNKTGKTFLAGDEKRKKDLAILWKLSNPHSSYTEIANQIGEHKSIVRKWFKEDPEVQEQYQFFVTHFREAALQLVETYSMEAVTTLVTLMRFGSEKYMFESAAALLDRGGVPKLTASEVSHTNTTEHQWQDQEALKAEIRKLPEELQEEAILAMEELEKLLAQHEIENQKKDSVINPDPKPEVEDE